MPKGGFFKRVLRGGEKEPRQESPSRPIPTNSEPPVRRSRDKELGPDPDVPAIESSYKPATSFETSDSGLSQKIAAAPATLTAESPPASVRAAEVRPAAIGDVAGSASITARAVPTSGQANSAPFPALHQPAPHWSPASPGAASVEGSEASYTSSTGSVSRLGTRKGKDNKAALHAANDRLQRAIQSAAKKKAASASPAQTSSQAAASRLSADAGATSSSSSGMTPSMAPAQAQAGHNRGASGQMPHTFSEASVLSAESDDEPDAFTDATSEAVITPIKPMLTDRYGFVISNADTPGSGTSASEASPSHNKESTRIKKWQKMLGYDGKNWNHFYARRAAKVKQRVRKGIPNAVRGLAWQLLSGSHELAQLNPGVYSQLVTMDSNEKDNEISRDLARTYPTHVFYQQSEGIGQQSLYHVLKTYSVYDKKVGYVQGMGFIAGLLLLYMNEENTFWTLVALLKGAVHDPMERLYQAGLPLLQQYLYQFEHLVQEELPRLAEHMEEEGVLPTMYCSQWFLTLYAYTLPIEHLLRVWDIFLLEGPKILFRVGLAVLKLCEDKVMDLPFEQILAVINSKQCPAFSDSPDMLMKMATNFKVSKRLAQYKARYDGSSLPAEVEAAAEEERANMKQHHRSVQQLSGAKDDDSD